MEFAHLPLAAVNFATLPEQLVNGLLLGAIYALIALGYTMVYGVLKLINFAHGDVYMLGAYVALFASYLIGYSPAQIAVNSNPAPLMSGTLISSIAYVFVAAGILGLVLNYRIKRATVGLRLISACCVIFGLLFVVIGKFEPRALNLVIMMVSSMVVCALVGIVIERFAYRPMRAHSRIASLITAIGVSLFLEFAGAIFLPNSPPPSIAEKVNPIRTTFTAWIVPPPKELALKVDQLKPAYEGTKKELDAYLDRTHESLYSLSDPGAEIKARADDAESAYNDALRKASSAGVSLTVPYSRVIIFVSVIVLMAALTYLVLATPAGRAMRAVSHDFDSASLMGINVDHIVTFTFVIGSALAGAGAMMTATFQGTPLTSFYGLLPGVKAFVAAVLGGIGNIPGAVLGGLLMGLAENLVVWA
ncbi:MAG TPA: branched-chain amino acid ABC transporter permease, partial [Fimbriimonadaceae bacterium]|nr:branched-chain amino acid ABC transporter permease [Fimbriimonadaceae bacterium]